jgi:hypothetical protein
MNTNLSPQRVARIVFRAIRRFEYCSRTTLEKYHYATQTKGLTHPRPAICDAEELGLAVGQRVGIRTVISHRPSNSTHAFRNVWLNTTSR